jgi:hypothetical protein
MPADTPVAEGEGVATPDPWAGARLSNAYDYIKCPQCGEKNDLRAVRCSRCRYEFPQPSADVTDPAMVFVPGKGYYREGTLLEPAESRKDLWIPGLVFTGVGLVTMEVAIVLAAEEEVFGGEDTKAEAITFVAGGVITIFGAVLIIVGVTSKTQPVYAFRAVEPTGMYARGTLARRSREDCAGFGFKAEMPVWGF